MERADSAEEDGASPCANVKLGTAPASYCDCSLGWQGTMFETVFGKPVEVAVVESLLRGGKTCRFEIRVPS